MRILLVEDDFLIGDGIKTGLEKLGFNIDWFQDGEDGEEALMPLFWIWDCREKTGWKFCKAGGKKAAKRPF